MSSGPSYRTALTQHVGERDYQEDSVRTAACRWGNLVMVADGMGGAAGGEVASRMALEELPAILDGDETSQGAVEALTKAIQETNARVHRAAKEGDPALRSMGTTLVVALLQDDAFYLGHVGDSRAYLLRRGELACLTQDHTKVQELLSAGLLTSEEADEHPEGHVLSRNIGGREKVDPAVVGPFPLEGGDRLMLCSDGLWGVLPQEEIARLLGSAPPKEAGAALVEAVLARGTKASGGDSSLDNVTVAVVEVERVVETSSARQASKPAGQSRMLLVGVVTVGLALAALALLWRFRTSQAAPAPVPPQPRAQPEPVPQENVPRSSPGLASGPKTPAKPDNQRQMPRNDPPDKTHEVSPQPGKQDPVPPRPSGPPRSGPTDPAAKANRKEE